MQPDLSQQHESHSKIDWTKIQNFTPDEFSEYPNIYATPKLIYSLQGFREILDRPIYPSPARGALARVYETESLHRVDLERHILSRAVDCFPEGDPREVFVLSLACQLWGAVGFYLDTKYKGKPWVMFHLDIRPLGYGHSKRTVLIWVRDEGKYYYPQYMEAGMGFLAECLARTKKFPW